MSCTRLRYALLSLSLFSVAAVADPAVAQPPAQGGVIELSLDDALHRAEQYVPLLVRAHNEELAVRAKREGAAVLLSQNPYATFMGGYRRETTSTPTATGFQYQFHLEQALEVAGQRRTRLDSVAAQLSVALNCLNSLRSSRKLASPRGFEPRLPP